MAGSHADLPPSPWVVRWAHLVQAGAAVLDLACGNGRHARFFAAAGCQVVGADRDAAALAGLDGVPGVVTRLVDLEGAPWPFAPESFDAVVVTNYLHRPQFADILACLKPRGVLIYETFMAGNERFGKPSNPDFLLQPGELIATFGRNLNVAGFEQGALGRPPRAMVQRLCAVRDRAETVLLPA
jgi:SAM-dependent methyltransferase